MRELVAQIAAITVDDGLVFDPAAPPSALSVTRISTAASASA